MPNYHHLGVQLSVGEKKQEADYWKVSELFPQVLGGSTVTYRAELLATHLLSTLHESRGEIRCSHTVVMHKDMIWSRRSRIL